MGFLIHWFMEPLKQQFLISQQQALQGHNNQTAYPIALAVKRFQNLRFPASSAFYYSLYTNKIHSLQAEAPKKAWMFFWSYEWLSKVLGLFLEERN